MEISIQTKSSHDIVDIEERLRDFVEGVRFVQKNAVNDALKHLKTMTSRRIRERYDIKKSMLENSDNHYLTQRIVPADDKSPTAALIISGQQIPLYAYNGTYPTRDQRLDYYVTVNIGGAKVRARPSVRAQGHQLRDTVPTPLTGEKGYKAFVATMPSGHTGIFARDAGRSSENSDAITELFGSSAAKMIESDEVADALSRDATEWYEKRLHHYVMALLNGHIRASGSGRGRRR